MLEDTWHMDFPGGGAYPMWESYPVFQTKPKKEDIIGLAEAITKSILLTGDNSNVFYNVVEFGYSFWALFHTIDRAYWATEKVVLQHATG